MSDFIWVTALRLLSALAALVAPLPAFFLSGHLDRRDWSLLNMAGASEHQHHLYHYWDKSLDTFTLAVACYVALRWKDPLVRRLAITTFAWRVGGVVMFMVTGQHAAFVVFPSVFERLFFFYLLFRLLSRQEIMLRSQADAIVTMVALAIPKIADEYFIHIAARPWQTFTLLPSAVSTPDREYWLWIPIMLALPALAMTRLLLQNRRVVQAQLGLPAAQHAHPIPIVTALLGRQVPHAPGGMVAAPAATPIPLRTPVHEQAIHA